MKRASAVLVVLGWVWAATVPAYAQTTMKLFGKTYNVTTESRAQTYKTTDGKEVKVVLQPTVNDAGDEVAYGRRGTLYFTPGADPSKDSLFIGAQIGDNQDTPDWHGLYRLTGADANGNFSPASATLTEFFGGAGNRSKNGRPMAILLLNEVETGVKKDRNFLIMAWTGDNGYHLYDLDSMKSSYQEDEIFFGIIRDVGGPTEDKYTDVLPDDNSPYGSYWGVAPLPTNDNHTVLVLAQGDVGGTQAAMWDTRTDRFFPVLTDLSEQTASAAIPLPTEQFPHALVHYSGDEYWMLASSPAPGGLDTNLETNDLYRLKLTLPADPAKAKAGDIKVEVLGKEPLMGSVLGGGPGGVFGLAAGREVAPGLRRLYFATNDGNLCVATPAP